MSQILNGRYEIFDPTKVKWGAQGVVFFVKDKNDNNQMYCFNGTFIFIFNVFFLKKSHEKTKWR